PKSATANRRPKLASKPKAAAMEPPAAADAAMKKPRAGPQASVDVLAEKVGNSLKVTFPFEAPAPATIFRRSRTVWMVFETDVPIKLGEIKDLAAGMVERAELVRRSGVQVVRLVLSRPWLTYANRQNEAWTVNIGNMVSGKTQALSLRRGLRSDRRSIVTIALKDPGRVHWFDDPEIGDRLAVVTALGPPRSLIKSQNFVDFKALATAHGVAVMPRTDDLAVRIRVDEVMLTRQDGLTLSAGQAHQYAPGSKTLDRSKKSRPGLLDIEAWQQGGPKRFSRRVGELERAIAAVEEKDKNQYRLELARLFVSHNLAAEALGVIRQMTVTDANAKADPVLNILMGVANLWLGRLREARQQLSVHGLANDKDAALWRSQVHLREKNWEEVLKNFHDGLDAMTFYPPEVQALFRLGAARAALELRRLNFAADVLDAIAGVRLPAHVTAHAILLRGRYFEQLGRVEDAIDAYNRTIEGDIRPLAAEAELRKTSLQLKNERIKYDEATKALERLRIIWRGDETELGTLRELANLYVKQGKYRQAFSTMKTAVLAFPKSQSALKIQDEMKEVFNDLFLHGKADLLQPVAALSLYYDFREMTPVGRLGDEMIRRLASRLISVDLLDQASELLDHQVNKRLKGSARAQVATRLAMVHLMNRKPALALRSIRLTRQPDLPQSLKRSRDMLEARALGDLGRVEAAVDILDSLKGPEVDMLKADALWNAQKWLKAGEQLEKMLGTRWQEAKELGDGERFDVLRAAISYSLGTDQFALDRLRKKFYPLMVKSPDAEAFILVTKPVKVKGRAFRTLAKQIASVDTLEAFMKKFRERYDGAFRPRKSSGVMPEGARG
ncbi:MAG: tetratricopeptide repeat protein, partial [Methyloligellaceae bacterium]